MIETIAQYSQSITVFVLFLSFAYVIASEMRMEAEGYRCLIRQIDLWNKQTIERAEANQNNQRKEFIVARKKAAKKTKAKTTRKTKRKAKK